MRYLEMINDFVWGIPALLMILGVGMYLSLRTGFIQLRLLPQAIKAFFAQFRGQITNGKNSPYQALCTALAATVGTGNLIGVAGAIVIGGPGAIFWMWVCALLGMVTKFAEATLAVRYRSCNASGEYVGGPMYMIQNGLGKGWAWLAWMYCIFGLIASFGVGNATQINAVVTGMNSMLSKIGFQPSFPVNLLLGLMLGVLVAGVLSGGARRIGDVAQSVVPIVSAGYIILCVVVLILKANQIPVALIQIVKGAFSPRAATGGMLGSAFQALSVGASRGTFTNEAGMGTASIAHAGANVKHPVEQGMMGIIEVFLDTIVICTMTALVILCSGIYIPYGADSDSSLTMNAFCGTLGEWVSIPLSLTICCLAVATIFGWSLYGARCAQFLFGERAWKTFLVMQSVTVVIGATISTEAAWLAAETLNGLMAIPNLIALVSLSPELLKLVKTYKTGT